MTKTKFGLIFMFLMLVLVLILSQCHEKPPITNNISLHVTQKIAPKQKTTIEEKIADKKNTSLLNELNSINELQISPELNFLTAFRQYTFFTMCENIINDLEQNKNPLDFFRSETEYKNKMFGYSGGKDHENHFLDHVENCKDLLKFNDETFDQAFSRLKTTYQSIEPKTDEEIELAKDISLFENIEELKTQLAQAQKGVSSLSDKAKHQINLEFENLNNILAPLQSISVSERTIEQANQITYYLNKRRALFKKNSNSYHIDEELIKSLNQEYNENVKLLTDSITSIKSSDIYTLMTRRGVFSYHLRKISEHSKKNTPFKDNYYPDVLTRTSLPLFACALGYPCAQGSQITLHHCIIMYNKNACGRSVEDFYLNHYISPNMQPDLNIFINYLFENYAND